MHCREYSGMDFLIFLIHLNRWLKCTISLNLVADYFLISFAFYFNSSCKQLQVMTVKIIYNTSDKACVLLCIFAKLRLQNADCLVAFAKTTCKISHCSFLQILCICPPTCLSFCRSDCFSLGGDKSEIRT